jgi:hypothetical protein
VVGLYIGYHLGQAVLSWRLRDVILKEARKEGIRVDNEYNIIEDDEDKPTVSQLFIERVNDTLYLYDREKDTFVCQATTVEDLAKLAKEYKNIKYAAVIDRHNSDVVAFVDGKVEINILTKIQ